MNMNMNNVFLFRRAVTLRSSQRAIALLLSVVLTSAPCFAQTGAPGGPPTAPPTAPPTTPPVTPPTAPPVTPPVTPPTAPPVTPPVTPPTAPPVTPPTTPPVIPPTAPPTTPTASGSIIGAKVQPAQRQILASQDNTLTVIWQVAVSNNFSGEVTSNTATIIDPSRGNTLLTVGSSQSIPGRRLITFSDTVDLPASTVKSWYDQGIRRVLLRRQFGTATNASGPSAQVVLSISSSGLRAQRESASSDLLVQRLNLSFTDNLRMKVVKADTELKAKLIVAYSGNGLLEGRWQLAEPGSTEGKAFYRTLTLVRQYLGNAQQTTLNSPPLPTTRAGKYRLRFCVTNNDLIPSDASNPDYIAIDPTCPIEVLSVEAIYEVTGNEATSAETLIRATPESGDINANSKFNWTLVNNAVIYQLQIFAAGEDNTKADEMLTQAPNFVAGMLLPVSTSTTSLSPLVLNKLEPGKTYLWRLTAHNQNGELIGKSREWRVRYTP